ncbi:hypothetical protein D3C85_1575900 [compost metagenome]
MKSRGLTVYNAVSSTMMDSAILKLKKMSRMKAGSGSTIIASSMMMMIGAARPLLALPFNPLSQAGMVRPFMVCFLYSCLLRRLRAVSAMRDSVGRARAARRVFSACRGARRGRCRNCAAGTRRPARCPAPVRWW